MTRAQSGSPKTTALNSDVTIDVAIQRETQVEAPAMSDKGTPEQWREVFRQLRQTAGPWNTKAALAIVFRLVRERSAEWFGKQKRFTDGQRVKFGEGLTERDFIYNESQNRFHPANDFPTFQDDFVSLERALESMVRARVPEALPEWPIDMVLRAHDALHNTYQADTSEAIQSRLLRYIAGYRHFLADKTVEPARRDAEIRTFAYVIGSDVTLLKWKSGPETLALSRKKSTAALNLDSKARDAHLHYRLTKTAEFVKQHVPRHQSLSNRGIAEALTRRGKKRPADDRPEQRWQEKFLSHADISELRPKYLPKKSAESCATRKKL